MQDSAPAGADKQKILYLFAALPVGGAERLLVDELRQLDRRRFEPAVCVLSEKGPIGEVIEREGIPLVVMGRMKSKRFDPALVLQIARLLSDGQFQVLHAHLYHAAMYGRMAARLISRKKRPKVFVTIHNIYPKPRPRRHWMNRWLARWTDAVVAVSDDVRESILRYDKIHPKKIRVIENGIDVERFRDSIDRRTSRKRLGISEEARIIGCVARLTEQKGHLYLIRAFAQVHRNFPMARLILVGDGELLGKLKNEATRLGVNDAVWFMGTQDDIPGILKSMDVFVLPSLWEGLGLAAAEAMAAGIPVIGTNVAGLRKLVIPDQTGYLVPPADPTALAAAIEAVLAHPEKLRSCVETAGSFVLENYSIQAHTRQLEALYTEFIHD